MRHEPDPIPKRQPKRPTKSLRLGGIALLALLSLAGWGKLPLAQAQSASTGLLDQALAADNSEVLIAWAPDSQSLLALSRTGLMRYDSTGQSLGPVFGPNFYPFYRFRHIQTDGKRLAALISRPDSEQGSLLLYDLVRQAPLKLLPLVWNYQLCATGIYTLDSRGIERLDVGGAGPERLDVGGAGPERLDATGAGPERLLSFSHRPEEYAGSALTCPGADRSLYYVTNPPDSYFQDGRPVTLGSYPQLWKLPGVGSLLPGQPVRLVKRQSTSSDYRMDHLRRSPDGKLLLYVSDLPPSLYALRLDAASPEPVLLSGNEHNGSPPIAAVQDAPVWLGREHVLFLGLSYAGEGAHRQLYRLRLAPEPGTPVALAGSEGIRQPVLSPDGRTLAYYWKAESGWRLETRPLAEWGPDVPAD